MIDWENFTPLEALAGGALIGLSAAGYLLLNGKITGIAGIVGAGLKGLRQKDRSQQAERFAFLLGLCGVVLWWPMIAPIPSSVPVAKGGWLIVAGLLVGVGTRMANGCTSGHGICGLGRLSLRSLVAVVTFMGAGMVTVFVLKHLI